MEFHEKLWELRKKSGLTQEELAERLYVSRTAISKWESGRGYPSIDSLKEISKFFSVTIDELICSEEIMIAAKDEKESSVRRLTAFICSFLDLFSAVLLFVPVFGNGSGSTAVPLLLLSGVRRWIVWLFFALIVITVVNGIVGAVIGSLEKQKWAQRSITAGMVMLGVCSAVFILTRQPYAGIICFSLLMIKGVLIIKMRQ